jgi:Dehydrogenase E1 component
MKESMEREPDYRRISFSGESYERVRRLCSRFAIRPRPLRAGSCQGEVGEGSAICRRPCTCDEVYGRLDRHRSLPLPWYTWKKEVVIVINNNQWAISAPRSIQTAAQTLAQKAIAAGIEGHQVDGNDVIVDTLHHLRVLAVDVVIA